MRTSPQRARSGGRSDVAAALLIRKATMAAQLQGAAVPLARLAIEDAQRPVGRALDRARAPIKGGAEP